jgi:MoxR-like ATPase
LNLEQFQASIETVQAAVRKVIIGQDDVIRHSLVAILCNQHALIEGVPGLGKTLLARTLAATLGCEFKRIQFTPDLMPADITGTNVFNLGRNEFSLL